MNRIAHLKVTCPQCGKYTSIYVEEGGASAKVKCEHCRQIFEFGRGMMYEPVAYVPSMPPWAVICNADKQKVFSQTIQCKQCGKSYSKDDAGLETNISKENYGLLDPSNPAVRKLLGLKSLLKCGNCSAIACSDCALESDGIVKMSCPFCKTNYTIYSFIKPTEENISGRNDANEQQANAPAVANVEEKPASGSDVSEANNHDKQEVTKTRHGCLTTLLLFMIIVNAIIAFIFAFFSDSIEISDELRVGQLIVSILTLICAVLVWKWQRIGFWGIVILSVIGFIGSLSSGEFLAAFQNFLPVFFLWVALSKEKDGVSGWKNLEYAKARIKSVPDSVSISATTHGSNSVHTKAMKPLPEGVEKPHVVLVHKVGSKYHRIDEEQKITGDYVEIGRDPKCQVRYDEHFETVSRRHAAIMKDDNHWKLFPLSKTNPTFINGKMVQKEWFLQHGDEIQCAINGPKLVFRLNTNSL